MLQERPPHLQSRQASRGAPSVRRVVQANIFNIMIAGFATGLEHGRLEYRHANSPEDAGFRLAGMNQLSLDFLELLFLQDKNQMGQSLKRSS